MKDAVHCTAVKFFFDDEISRCLEVESPLQIVPFFFFWSKLSSEYLRILVVPFLHCEISFFVGVLGLET